MSSFASYCFPSASLKAFFGYANERYTIFKLKEQGAPKPWTSDPILREYRFCNVFREDDKVTRWFKEHIREPFRGHEEIVFATIAFRLFNRPETAALLLGGCRGAERNLFLSWNAKEAHRRLVGVKPVVSAAYMCPTPIGFTKSDGCLEILCGVWAQRKALYADIKNISTMQEMVARLCKLDYMGKFRSYEVACDLQYTDCFNPTDTMEWANPGPGAKRGLSRLVYGTAKAPPNSEFGEADQINLMRVLLEASKNPSNWPSSWPAWDMRTVEHSCCEMDKYERVRLGEGRPKQKYPGL